MTTMIPREGADAYRLVLLGSEFPPGPGGIGTHAFQLATHLSGWGWDVQVLTAQAYVSDQERAEFNGRQPFVVKTLADRSAGLRWQRQRLEMIVETMKQFGPDVMVASGRRALWTAAAIQQRYHVPWIAIGHGSEFLSQSRPMQFLTAQSVKRATAVVAVSQYTADLIQQIATPARMVVIPNGADGERFYPKPADPDLCRELDLLGRQVLLTVGHVSERKAQDVVIRALPQIATRFPEIVYVMVGLPTRHQELQALADDLGVGDRVRFAGSVADDRLADYYNLADLFILVSRQASDGDVEGYGIVVKEAALCGKPSVVSQGCGLTEAIEEEVSGLSIAPEDPAATAEAVIELLADSTRRHAMGVQAREQAVQETWAHRVAAYDVLLREMVRSTST